MKFDEHVVELTPSSQADLAEHRLLALPAGIGSAPASRG
jgi:hypothetical protein